MRIYNIKQKDTDRDILTNMLDLLSTLDIILTECMMYHKSKPAHKEDKQYFQISNTISDNFKFIGLPAYHKHGPVKIYMDAV